MFISGTGPVGLLRVQDATFLSSSDSNIMNDIANIYPMSIVIFKSSLSEIILIFSLKTWDIHVYALT